MSEKCPEIKEDLYDEDEPYPSDDLDESLMPGEFDHHLYDREGDDEQPEASNAAWLRYEGHVIERLNIPVDAFQTDWVLDSYRGCNYASEEWIDKTWWAVLYWQSGKLGETGTCALFQELVTSGHIVGFKGSFRREFIRLFTTKKVSFPLNLN